MENLDINKTLDSNTASSGISDLVLMLLKSAKTIQV